MIFKNDFDYLLHLLRCAVSGLQPEEKPDNISFEKVLEYGRMHEVANIAYLSIQKLKTPPDSGTLNLWTQEYWKAVKRDAIQTKAKNEVLSALHSRGIYTLEVQGTYVKKFYPQSHLRMMSDMDLIVPEEHFSSLEDIMHGLGYETVKLHDMELDVVKGSVHIELHTEFFDERSLVHTAIGSPRDYISVDGEYNAVVDDTVFYLFHLLHTIKHCMQDGSGLRRITDLYYLEKAMSGRADMKKIDSILVQHGFYDAKLQLIAVMNHWFYGIEPETDVSDLETDIRLAGNHGTEELFYRHKFDREKAKGKHFVKLKYFLSLIFFLPKEKLYSYYPFLEKHNSPLFVCRLYRLFRIVFSRYKLRKLKTVLRWMRGKNKDKST